MRRAISETIGLIAMLAVALFASANTVAWAAAWAFLAVYTVVAVTSLAIVDRALIAERSSVPPDIDRVDAALGAAFFILLYPATLVVSGLDRRFGWSPPIAVGVQGLALAVFTAGYGFGLWAMRVNAFFSTFVRFQGERGHRVIDSGPYAHVRHPGYAGALAAHLALPVALGSLWALIPAACGGLLLALRSVREERTLVEKLSGYCEYRRRVRWRLIPRVW
ncbi:MAG TPA: isoprenylcysteine carboxylmethyltransferase family protein [Candidatus Binatia bacterium]|nr:isoprenylcysteine carboxylmethyltransferase family protein [Candidatus Binatia bacterium]